MKSLTEETATKFREAAMTFFDPVAKSFELQLVASGSTEYSIPLRELTVRVRLIPSHVPDPVVAIFSNDPKWLRESRLSSWGVSLLKFVQYQAPAFDFADPRLSSRAELSTKMALLAELLTKFCEPLLRGDVSLWQNVAKRAEDEVIQKLEPSDVGANQARGQHRER